MPGSETGEIGKGGTGKKRRRKIKGTVGEKTHWMPEYESQIQVFILRRTYAPSRNDVVLSDL